MSPPPARLTSLLTLLALLWGAPAAAVEMGDGGPSLQLCGHLNPYSDEGKLCSQVCREQPAEDDCLVALRFGPPGISFLKAHDPKNTPDIPAAAQRAGFAPEEAARLRWFLTTDLGWDDPRNPISPKSRPPQDKLDAFFKEMDALRATKDLDVYKQMDAANKFVGAAERAFGHDDPYMISVLGIASGFMAEGGMQIIADQYFERLLKLCDAHLPPDHPERLMAMTRAGAALMRAGKREQGERLMQEGLAGMLAQWGPHHQNMIWAWRYAREAYMATGEYARARVLTEDVLRANLRLKGLASAGTRDALIKLAEVLAALGDHSIASIALTTAQMTLIGDMESEDAIDYHLTQAKLEQVQAWDADRSRDRVRATNHYKAALRGFSTASKVAQKVHGQSPPITPEAMMGLGELFARLDKDPAAGLKKGLEAMSVAHQLRKIRLGPDHLGTIEVEARSAALKAKYGPPDEAIRAYEAVLARLNQHAPGAELLIGKAHRALVLLKWGVGDEAAARAHAAQSLAVLGDLFERDTARGLDDIQGMLRMAYNDHREALDEAVSLMQDKQAPQIFNALLSWHGAITRAAITQRAAWRVRRRLTTEQQRDHDLWRGALLRGGEMLAAPQAARARLLAAGVDVGELERPTLKDLCREVAQRDATLVQYLFYVRSERDAAARKIVPKQAHAMALLLDRRCKPVTVDLGAYDSFEPLIEGYRARVKEAEACFAQKGRAQLCQAQLGAMDAAGGALRLKVFDPIAKKLGKAKRLLIVPDGKLVQIALDALPGAKPGSYLIEQYEMSTIPYTSALLARPEVAPAEVSEAFVVGDVNYEQGAEMMRAMAALSVCSNGSCEAPQQQEVNPDMMVALRAKQRGGQPTCGRSAKWGRLVTEALAVAEMLSAPFGEHVYLAQGDGATEPLVRLQLPGKRFIHLATHGFLDSGSDCVKTIARSALAGAEEVFLTLDPPFRDLTRLSAIVVAGANAQSKDPADDGFISGAEIAELDLAPAELVVLSACETGLGIDLVGEGALGLTRGFVLAGAQTVVAALWQVPSAATSELFRDTYAALTRKKSPLPPAAALREAKLAALARARAQGAPASSLMWGAFVPLSARGAKR